MGEVVVMRSDDAQGVAKGGWRLSMDGKGSSYSAKGKPVATLIKLVPVNISKLQSGGRERKQTAHQRKLLAALFLHLLQLDRLHRQPTTIFTHKPSSKNG